MHTFYSFLGVLEPRPATAHELIQFVAYLASQPGRAAAHYAHSTVRSYVTAISQLHLDRDWPDPAAARVVERVIIGYGKLFGTGRHSKLAFTVDNLRRIELTVDRNDPVQVRNFTAMLVGFFALLRKSEYTVRRASDAPPLLRRDLTMLPAGALLHIRKSKTDQAGEGAIVPIGARGDSICPIAWLRLYLHLAQPPPDAALFLSYSASARCFQPSSPLSHTSLVSYLKAAAANLGFNPAVYSGHSLRSGGATFMLTYGASVLAVKAIGRWRSDTYQIYYRATTSDLLSLARLDLQLDPLSSNHSHHPHPSLTAGATVAPSSRPSWLT